MKKISTDGKLNHRICEQFEISSLKHVEVVRLQGRKFHGCKIHSTDTFPVCRKSENFTSYDWTYQNDEYCSIQKVCDSRWRSQPRQHSTRRSSRPSRRRLSQLKPRKSSTDTNRSDSISLSVYEIKLVLFLPLRTGERFTRLFTRSKMFFVKRNYRFLHFQKSRRQQIYHVILVAP